MDKLRKSSHLISEAVYVGTDLSLPMRGTTEDLCAALCVSNLKCDIWNYAPDGSCTLGSLGEETHALINEGKERINVSNTPRKGYVSGRIQYEHRGDILSTISWVLLGIVVVLFVLWLMKDCNKK